MKIEPALEGRARAIAAPLLSLLLTAAGCGRRAAPGVHADTESSASSASPVPQRPEPDRVIPAGAPCGDLECAQYDSPADAFHRAIAGEPLVVGVGEVHAPRGATVPSAAVRFTGDLLPLLAGLASDLLVELMMPPSGCVDAAVEVHAQQAVVRARQADNDQGEYLRMGERARSLAIVPDMLRPSCEDLDTMRGDGASTIDVSLETIARLTVTQAKTLIARDARSDADSGKMVVVYGGALHNDLAPTGERARWSYAPDLDAYTHGRYVALDLVVPEFIGDDDVWRSLPWRAAYDAQRLGSKTTLFRVADRSFVLVFPLAAK
jgi:hypothetical protein